MAGKAVVVLREPTECEHSYR
ncbi:protein of unknown function [Burkholderia multivorans]